MPSHSLLTARPLGNSALSAATALRPATLDLSAPKTTTTTAYSANTGLLAGGTGTSLRPSSLLLGERPSVLQASTGLQLKAALEANPAHTLAVPRMDVSNRTLTTTTATTSIQAPRILSAVTTATPATTSPSLLMGLAARRQANLTLGGSSALLAAVAGDAPLDGPEDAELPPERIFESTAPPPRYKVCSICLFPIGSRPKSL